MNEEAGAMLLELADFLDTLPEHRFDYRSWVGWDWEGAEDLSCGTTACAAGWATTLPSFRARGLRLYLDSSGPWRGIPRVEGSELDGEEAMAEVLGISEVDAGYLFIPDYRHPEWGVGAPTDHATPQEVADHIRDYLELRS